MKSANGASEIENLKIKSEDGHGHPASESLTHRENLEQRQLNEALQTQYKNLEGKYHDSTQLAAKALLEKAQTEKALDLLQVKNEGLREQIQVLQRAKDDFRIAHEASVAQKETIVEVHKGAIATLRFKYDNVKVERNGLRAAHDDLKAANDAAIEEHANALTTLRAKYVAVKEERRSLRASSSELENRLRSLEERLVTIKSKYKTEREDLRKSVHSLEDTIQVLKTEQNNCATQLEEEKNFLVAQFDSEYKTLRADYEQARILDVCRVYMKHLPLQGKFPTIPELHPICRTNDDLYAHLSKDSTTKSFLNYVLYLPARTLELGNGHVLAFGPTSRYNHQTQAWVVGSDLRELYKVTRELFIDRNGHVLYMGTYKCHDLHNVYSKNVELPRDIPESILVDVALGVPQPAKSISERLIKQQYPTGEIDVEATGLQLVGFNQRLYEALCKGLGVVPGPSLNLKRKSISQSGAGGSPAKKPKIAL